MTVLFFCLYGTTRLFGGLTEEDPPVAWLVVGFGRPVVFGTGSFGFGLEAAGCPFFVRKNLVSRDGAFCIRSAATSEALPTEYSVSPTEQPSSDALSSYSVSPDPMDPDNSWFCWLAMVSDDEDADCLSKLLPLLSVSELGDLVLSLRT